MSELMLARALRGRGHGASRQAALYALGWRVPVCWWWPASRAPADGGALCPRCDRTPDPQRMGGGLAGWSMKRPLQVMEAEGRVSRPPRSPFQRAPGTLPSRLHPHTRLRASLLGPHEP